MISKEQLIEIYLDGFNDSHSFAEWFVGSAHSDNVFTYCENGTLISAGYIVEKNARLFGKSKVLPYLSALSTKKEYRGRGKIAAVIKQAFEALYNRGYVFVALNPFQKDYYKRFGFTDISFCKKMIVAGGKNYSIALAGKNNIKQLCRIEYESVKQFDNYLIKDETDILKLIESFKTDGIECNLLYDEGSLQAFYFNNGNKIEYYASVSPNVLLGAENLKGVEFDDYINGDETYIQGRIINAEKAILECVYDTSIQGIYEFIISDDFFEKNNIKITVEILGGSAKLSSKPPMVSLCIDISELCGRVFSGGGIFKQQKNLFKDKY